jgi:hypothetical protein
MIHHLVTPEISYEDIVGSFNIYLNVIMCLLVWSKIGSFVLTNKNFGVYIRMLTHMLVYLLVFLIIWGSWILCCSQIFTLLFYQENEDFESVE